MQEQEYLNIREMLNANQKNAVRGCEYFRNNHFRKPSEMLFISWIWHEMLRLFTVPICAYKAVAQSLMVPGRISCSKN